MVQVHSGPPAAALERLQEGPSSSGVPLQDRLDPGEQSCQLELRAREIGGVAQLVEHLVCNQAVVGSSPVASTQGGPLEERRVFGAGW